MTHRSASHAQDRRRPLPGQLPAPRSQHRPEPTAISVTPTTRRGSPHNGKWVDRTSPLPCSPGGPARTRRVWDQAPLTSPSGRAPVGTQPGDRDADARDMTSNRPPPDPNPPMCELSPPRPVPHPARGGVSHRCRPRRHPPRHRPPWHLHADPDRRTRPPPPGGRSVFDEKRRAYPLPPGWRDAQTTNARAWPTPRRMSGLFSHLSAQPGSCRCRTEAHTTTKGVASSGGLAFHRLSADDLAERRVSQHVRLAAMQCVLVDHLDQSGTERLTVPETAGVE
jgi:hypothetical protein